MTFEDRVTALSPLGFSDRQTRFLVMVALHSGFCLRRHYTAFTGLKEGAGVRAFLDRLVSRRLARRAQFRRDRGYVYHLHASSIYAAIGQDDNRNRRSTGPALIARKIMLLDYVMADPTGDWLATEEDKVHRFTIGFGVPASRLPNRIFLAQRHGDPDTVRYFLRKLPILIAGNPALPHFVYLVTDLTGAGFTGFLQDHLRLLNALPAWRLVTVAPRHIPGLPACQPTLRRFALGLLQPRPAAEVSALERYFALRDRVDRNDLRQLSISDIDRFRDLRHRFASSEFEELFERWKVEGAPVLQIRDGEAFIAALRDGRGELVTYRLPLRYDGFGSLAGLS